MVSSLVEVPKAKTPAPVPETVDEDVDGVSDSSEGGGGDDDCETSSVGSDTSDTDLTNWRTKRGLPIVHKGPTSGSRKK